MNFNDIFFIKPIDVPNKLNLINIITDYVNINTDLTPKKWKCQVSSSYEHEHRYKFDFGNLKSIILIEYREYARNLNLDQFGDPNICDIWWNYYIGSSFQEKHDHLDADFSGVIYLKFDNTVHLPTIFYNPIFSSDLHVFKDIPNICYLPEITENNIIFFPSSVPHEVLPHNTNISRITLSFNIEYPEFKPNYLNYF